MKFKKCVALALVSVSVGGAVASCISNVSFSDVLAAEAVCTPWEVEEDSGDLSSSYVATTSDMVYEGIKVMRDNTRKGSLNIFVGKVKYTGTQTNVAPHLALKFLDKDKNLVAEFNTNQNEGVNYNWTLNPGSEKEWWMLSANASEMDIAEERMSDIAYFQVCEMDEAVDKGKACTVDKKVRKILKKAGKQGCTFKIVGGRSEFEITKRGQVKAPASMESGEYVLRVEVTKPSNNHTKVIEFVATVK